MRTILKIAKTELRDLFFSPIAWLILIIFAFQTGMSFAALVIDTADSQHNWGYAGNFLTINFFGGMYGILTTVQSYLYLYVPLLTMGLMSRELGSGSIKLLYSSPITNFEIIVGKFVGMMGYGLVLMAVLFVYAIWAFIAVENVDAPLILSGLLGIYLLYCAYVAIGLFMSSLTSYQIVAAVGTLAVLALLSFVKGMWQEIPFVREITYWFGISGRADTFVGGMICSEDVIYFLVVISLFLALTIFRLQLRRHKVYWTVALGKYLAICIVAVGLAYFSSRPALLGYWDVTATKMNTLTPNSQEIIKKLDGGLTITTYTNILDDYASLGHPRNYVADQQMFRQYLRFKPEIKMKYVWYYDTVKSDYLERRYPGLSYKEKAEKVMEEQNYDPDDVLTPEEIRKQVDLRSASGNRFVRLYERENGEKAFVRVYDDYPPHPEEAEITAALKRMVMELPTVGFLTGHGERETNKMGDRHYGMFSHMPTFRHSLINQGFDYCEVTLDKPVPEEVSILVIGEMREPMTEAEKVNYDQFLARGGNLFLIGEPGRQEVMNPLMEEFGVRMVEGSLIQPEKVKKVNENNKNVGAMANFESPKHPIDLSISRVTKEAADIAYIFRYMRYPFYAITMPTAGGLEYTEDKGFKVTKLIVSDSTAFNEMETTDIINEKPVINPEIGEVQKCYPTCLALSRPLGDKEQKIIIMSDADCISDGEISISRPGLRSGNYGIIQGGFFWLSDGKAPIDVRRPESQDRKISTTPSGAEMLQYLLMGGIPLAILLLYLFIWVRRRGR